MENSSLSNWQRSLVRKAVVPLSIFGIGALIISNIPNKQVDDVKVFDPNRMSHVLLGINDNEFVIIHKLKKTKPLKLKIKFSKREQIGWVNSVELDKSGDIIDNSKINDTNYYSSAIFHKIYWNNNEPKFVVMNNKENKPDRYDLNARIIVRNFPAFQFFDKDTMISVENCKFESNNFDLFMLSEENYENCEIDKNSKYKYYVNGTDKNLDLDAYCLDNNEISFNYCVIRTNINSWHVKFRIPFSNIVRWKEYLNAVESLIFQHDSINLN